MKIKTRFAPSPTGYLHLGGARTALYSWLYARHNNGEFILRIEDSDLKRLNSESIKVIIDSMKWLNLLWDKGPFFQTKRFDRYNSIIDSMLNKGTAYKCYCSKEKLEKIRSSQLINNEQPKYDRFCRKKNYNNLFNKSYVVRFKNPKTGIVKFVDQIRGLIEFKNENLDDLIIRRSDGTPTYNFCSVIDDLDMEITHVIRGEDHINNTPRQINILKALNAKVPCYAHVSMIVGENKKKLSKRHETISLLQYRNDGYLPESILNYLVRLGWSHGDQEIFNINEMIKFFNLDTISKASSIFDIKKLQWLNQHYIKNLPAEYVANQLKWHFLEQNINIDNGPKLIEIVYLLRDRCKTLKEIVKNSFYFYEELDDFDLNVKKYLSKKSILPLQLIHKKLCKIKEWTVKNIHDIVNLISVDLKLGFDKIAMPLRIAITGRSFSPPIHKIIYIIGRDKSITRIEKIITFIKLNI